ERRADRETDDRAAHAIEEEGEEEQAEVETEVALDGDEHRLGDTHHHSREHAARQRASDHATGGRRTVGAQSGNSTRRWGPVWRQRWPWGGILKPPAAFRWG